MESSHPQEFHENFAHSYMVRPQTVPTFLKRLESTSIFSHNSHHPQFPALNVPTAVSPHKLPGSWSTGLCHCCDDPSNCLITATCPCITFGQIAEIVDEGSPSCGCSGAVYGLLFGIPAAACLYSCFNRSKMRARFDLEESPCPDCLVHFCCECCALCQEYRQLQKHGFDMGIGWEANQKRMSGRFTTPPIIGTMRRS